jgi:hypothetical protein
MNSVLALQPPPWYRQFWPWVLIGLPGIAVVASISSLFIALHGADDIVADNYYKQGLAINRELTADDNARRMHLHGAIEFAADEPNVHLKLESSDDQLPAQLTLRFIHPVSAARDFAVALLRDAANDTEHRYRARLPLAMNGRWTIDIEDPAAHWRLRREITLTSQQRDFAIEP